MFAIEVEYLSGVAFAATTQSRDVAEWPPHPDRLFSALLAAWAETDRDAGGEAALRWLERQPPPVIIARRAQLRDVVGIFVPPNDLAGTDIRAVPALRKNRQPRYFPAATLGQAIGPTPAHAQFCWPEVPEPAIAAALDRLARIVPALGHSTSLVRLRVLCPFRKDTDALEDGDCLEPSGVPGGIAVRWVYPGRLDELNASFKAVDDANRGRRSGPPEVFRPDPGPARAYHRQSEHAPAIPSSLFGDAWVVFADAGGSVPELTAFAHVAKVFRNALMDAAPQPPPETLSGHASDGMPLKAPHMAIVPLADVGWSYSGGRLFGFAAVLPRGMEADEHRASPDRIAILKAFGAMERQGSETGLTLGRLGVWRVKRQSVPELRSLDPKRYTAASTAWATVTPIVLDRFPKVKDGKSAEDVVAEACVNIGLPRPIEVALYKHAAVRGAPSAWPAGGNPPWCDWSFPDGAKLSQRPRTHAVVRFEAPVRGPIILGAGRFLGIGLCLPIGETGR